LDKSDYNHTRLNTLFAEAGAPGDPPAGNCVQKCDHWLKVCNADPAVDAFGVLGKVVENFMELDRIPSPWDPSPPGEDPGKKRVRDILARHGLSYAPGGVILGAGSSPASKSLQELLRVKDLLGVEKEFQRALATVETDPPAGVTAACSLLEALFRVYIEDEGLQLPAKQTIGDLYKVVRDHMRHDPAQVAEQDLKRILSGLISVVDGVGALRTHTGSAHGHGRQGYRLEPRHARLAINGAHTLALFILETWSHREEATG
jgi:Abortive infection C-terminus